MAAVHFDTAKRNGHLQRLQVLEPSAASYAQQFVDVLLSASVACGVSDVHLQPTANGLWIRWRIDGVLQDVGVYSPGETSDVVARLKVLASLLTYRSDAPQEGRLEFQPNASRNGERSDGGKHTDRQRIDMRVSTFPTQYGERAVVRLFAADDRLEQLENLGMPGDIEAKLRNLLAETSGAILVTGPAGSGKTTTCYAALRHVVSATSGGRSIVSIEDPIEGVVTGVAQSQVHPSAGLDLQAGLKGLLRQDPEVLMVSEIRDPKSAVLALGASLTGHLVIGSFHAGSAAGAINRLSDMGVESYVLRSGVLAVVCQRLVRRLCRCARPAADDREKLGLPARSAQVPTGCERCLESGYRGRVLLVELLLPREDDVAQAILNGSDADTLENLALAGGMTSRWERALAAVENGTTSPAEVRRVLGFGDPWRNGRDGGAAS